MAWRNHGLRAACATAFLVANIHAADSAQINVLHPGAGALPVVLITGALEPSDVELFKRSTEPLSRAIVRLESPGGALVAGIRIGRMIRMRGFSTEVTANATCVSACALAWLGGAQRYMSNTSKIGFHAAYIIEADGFREIGVGNALIGAYLEQLGLPESAIIFVTIAAPRSMNWLSSTTAGASGIDVVQGSETTYSQAPSRSIVHLVQLAQKRTQAEAEAHFAQLRVKHSSELQNYEAIILPVNLESRGNFFRVYIGPFRDRSAALQICNSLKVSGGVCIIVRAS